MTRGIRIDGKPQFSVKMVKGFCGYPKLLEIISQGETQIYKELMATLFLTGLRIHEVIPFVPRGAAEEKAGLRKENFRTDLSNRYIVLKEVRLLKAYKAADKWQCLPCDKRWTKAPELGLCPNCGIKVEIFPNGRPERLEHIKDIIIDKQMPAELIELLLSKVRQAEDYLFEGVTYWRAYMAIRKAGDKLGMQIAPHFFRSQRAFQLKKEKDASAEDLKHYFGWSDTKMAEHYAGTTDYRELMRRGIG